jgi:hypothetical protein
MKSFNAVDRGDRDPDGHLESRSADVAGAPHRRCHLAERQDCPAADGSVRQIA